MSQKQECQPDDAIAAIAMFIDDYQNGVLNEGELAEMLQICVNQIKRSHENV